MHLSFRVEESFAQYSVDVYLPEFHVGLEADGPYHMQKHDMKRDELLYRDFGLPILRIDQKVLRNEQYKELVKSKIVEFIDRYGREAQASEVTEYRSEAFGGDVK